MLAEATTDQGYFSVLGQLIINLTALRKQTNCFLFNHWGFKDICCFLTSPHKFFQVILHNYFLEGM